MLRFASLARLALRLEDSPNGPGAASDFGKEKLSCPPLSCPVGGSVWTLFCEC